MKNFIILVLGLIVFGGSISIADIIIDPDYEREYDCEDVGGSWYTWYEKEGEQGLSDELRNQLKIDRRRPGYEENMEYYSYCINVDRSFQSALDMAYHLGLTKYNDIKLFNSQSFITREQIAKMIIRTRIISGDGWSPRNSSIDQDQMIDESSIDPTLSGYVKDAINSKFMKGRNSRFYPKHNVTYAQAITILGRIYGHTDENDTDMRWRSHEKYAIQQGYLKEYYKNPHNPISRGEFIQLIYNWVLSKSGYGLND